jgi:DNA-binding LacI/PurR family transcriptional regulator
VAVPTEIAATMAVKLLRALIDGSAVGPLMDVAPAPHLVVRASTGAARNRCP